MTCVVAFVYACLLYSAIPHHTHAETLLPHPELRLAAHQEAGGDVAGTSLPKGGLVENIASTQLH